MPFNHHSEIINYIISKRGFTSYLEIGVHVPAHNFDLIKCRFKVGVDPNGKGSFTGTSDEWFEFNKYISETTTKCGTFKGFDVPIKFDLIFIDGLHFSEQVQKDFENSLACLNDNGIILIHDTDPKEERYSVYPRQEPRRWNGDVFKFITQLPGYSEIDWRTPDFDANGLTVVKRSNRVKYDPLFGMNIDWQTFKNNRASILQLCNENEFKEWI